MKQSEKKKYEKILGSKKVYELTPEEMMEPISKEMGELCRHRLEKRWYRRLVEINMLIIVFVIMLCVKNFSQNKEFAKKYIRETVNDNYREVRLMEYEIPAEISLIIYGVVGLLGGYVVLYIYYAMYRSMSIGISKKNFPEVYQIIEEYANRLGIPVPQAYVIQENGVLNAFSTFLFKKQWIGIHSEVMEVAYREHHDIKTLSFVIAHEMAHIYYGHATLHYNLPIWFSKRIPLIGSIASRTREYSCDRLAQRLTGDSGVEAMLMLTVDRHLYKAIDQEDYIDQLMKIKGFFVWIVNMCMDHPVMSKRVMALKEGYGSGDLY